MTSENIACALAMTFIPACRKCALPGWLILVSMVSVLLAAPAYANDIEQGVAKMRPVDRDWEYFKTIDCADIEKIVFHSRSEEFLVAKRKKQCLERYRAFMPVPVNR